MGVGLLPAASRILRGPAEAGPAAAPSRIPLALPALLRRRAQRDGDRGTVVQSRVPCMVPGLDADRRPVPALRPAGSGRAARPRLFLPLRRQRVRLGRGREGPGGRRARAPRERAVGERPSRSRAGAGKRRRLAWRGGGDRKARACVPGGSSVSPRPLALSREARGHAGDEAERPDRGLPERGPEGGSEALSAGAAAGREAKLKRVRGAWAAAAALGMAARLATGAPQSAGRSAPPSARGAEAAGQAAPSAPQVSGIEERLLAVVRTLADPKWEGRGVGTAGLDSAARYVAMEMAARGLSPAGDDGAYFQRMEVTTGVALGEPCSIEVRGRRYDVGEKFMPIGFSKNGTLRAPVVFAGYGITAPGYDYDDYAGLDARDKIVLVFTNEPGEMDSTSRFDGNVNTPHSELRTKAINAREHGALGLLVVEGPLHHAGEPLRGPRADGGGYMTSGLLAAPVSE